MRVVIRVDASSAIGSGHLMRCLTLAKAVAARGATAVFLSGPLDDHLSGEIAAFKIVPLISANASPEDACKAMLECGESVDWLVVDSYDLDKQWESAFRSIATRIMVVDDLANRDHDCDLLLDQGYGASAESYRARVGAACVFLMGTQFALLREEFSLARKSLHLRAAKRSSTPIIHVFFGGYDSAAHTTRYSEWLLDELPDVHVRAIVGARYPDMPGLNSLGRRFEGRFVWRKDVKDMSIEMSQCDLAVGAPGMATWERACLGLPAIYVATVPSQVSILERLRADGFCRYVGLAAEVDKLQVVESVRDILADPAAFERMRSKSLDAVDGEGAMRVANLLEAMHAMDGLRQACVYAHRARLTPYTVECDRQTVEWLNSQYVKEGFGFKGIATLSGHRSWIIANPNVVIFAIEDLNGTYCGNVLLHLNWFAASCYLQIYIGREESRGKGIGTSALTCALHWAFDIAGLKKVWLHALSSNAGAYRMYSKAGFVEEELERNVKLRDGSQCDQYRLSLSVTAWQSLESPK